MQRLAFPSLLATVLTCGAAFAAPLNLSPSTSANSSGVGAVFAAPAPAEPSPVRTAAAQNYGGGGFLEMLFRPGGPPPDQRSYQPAPDRSYQPEPGPMMAPNYRQPRPDAIEPDYDRMGSGLPSAAPARPAMNSRFEPQEVNYNGSERPGTIIINTPRTAALPRGGQWPRHAIRHRRRPAGIHLGRHPSHHQHARMAGLASAAGDDQASPGSAASHARRPEQSARRARHVSRLDALSHPWLERALDHRQAVSSGCIRMRNEDVIDLYRRLHVGTRVLGDLTTACH